MTDTNIPKVTIIMGVHQKSPYLTLAIESILNQTMSDFEFIIIANNCDDDLMFFLSTFKDHRIKLFRTQIGQLGFNLNLALNYAMGEIIFRMDSDDISLPTRLEYQYTYMQNNNIDVLGTSIILIDKDGQFIENRKFPLNNESIRKTMPYRNPFCHPSVAYRKSTIVKARGYLGGQISEDYGLWIRLRRSSHIKFENTEKELLKYRIHITDSQRNPVAYSEVSGLLLTEFLIQRDFSFLIGSIRNALNAFIKAKLT